MTRIIRDLVEPGLETQPHCYNVGSNFSHRFAMGNIGAKEDFLLVGLTVDEVGMFPLLTGVILGEDGLPILNLVDGMVTFNPQHCERIFQSSNEGWSYTISAPNGATVLQVETRPGIASSMDGRKALVTRIAGQFYDKRGAILVDVTHDRIEVPEQTLVHVGAKSFGEQISEAQADFINTVVHTKGAITYILSGDFKDQDILLDGAYLYNFNADNCRMVVQTGFWRSEYGSSVVENCTTTAMGMAGYVAFATGGAPLRSGVISHDVRVRGLESAQLLPPIPEGKPASENP